MEPPVLTIRKRDVTEWLAKLLETGEVHRADHRPVRRGGLLEDRFPGAGAVGFRKSSVTAEAIRAAADGPDRQDPGSTGKEHRSRRSTTAGSEFLFNVRPCDAKGIAFLTRMHEMDAAGRFLPAPCRKPHRDQPGVQHALHAGFLRVQRFGPVSERAAMTFS